MDELRVWVMTLCVCAVVINIADELMPEGGVKKTACFVLSLITASCLLSPVKYLADLRLDDIGYSSEVNTDWLSQVTSAEFAENTVSLIRDELSGAGVEADNIYVYTDIGPDADIYIDKVRIEADSRYKDRIGEIEALIYERLGLEADVVV